MKRHSFGLQLKAVIIIGYLVVGVVASGAWYYYQVVCDMTRQSDLSHARKLGKALSLAAEGDLSDKRYTSLDELTKDWVKDECVQYVAIVDRDGKAVSVASAPGKSSLWEMHTKFSADQAVIKYHGQNHLIIAHPVIAKDKLWYDERLAGGVRIVLAVDTTQKTLAATRQKIILITAIIVLCAIPIGYILVWQFMVRPIRRLARVTQRLADGDYSARSDLTSKDETGELAFAFDHMAGQVSAMRSKLLANNMLLERKVSERTEELQHANDKLCAEMKDKEEFLRAVSHDLNAPLRNIAGMATMISLKWRDQLPEDVIARLQRIQSNVDHETSLLEELLELSRIKTRPQSRKVVDIGQMLQTLGNTFEYELQSRHIALEIEENMPALNIEPNRIRQVFQNLIDNAIKYMDRETDGRIIVGHKLIDGVHEFCVKDNGPGIPEDQQEKVFCVFRRGSASSSARADGKGVGLAVVRTVVSTYNGKAWVTSSPGQGACFYFTLSAKATAPDESLAEAPEEVTCA